MRFNKEDQGELLGMPYPYTVPCAEDGFRCMYYWDTYFTNLGLIVKGEVLQAKHNADNMLYLIEKYGFMPNGNMTRYLNRSQPPFLYLMIKDVFDCLGDKIWLNSVYSTLCKEYSFWQTERKSPNGLNFYGNFGCIDEALTDEYCGAFRDRSGGYTTDDPDERLRIAKTFMTFCETGNLWEKYDGNTGKVANQDYEAPTMMGWTAGVYLRFKEDFK